MVSNMNDLSKSFYSSSRTVSMSAARHSRSNSSGQFQIVSINKDNTSNQHTIRIGMPYTSSTSISNSRSTDASHIGVTRPEVQQEIHQRSNIIKTDSLTIVAKQKENMTLLTETEKTVKNRNNCTHSGVPMKHARSHSQDTESSLPSSGDDDREHVVNVASRRAMFESTANRDSRKDSSLKSWKSGPALSINRDGIPSTQPVQRDEHYSPSQLDRITIPKHEHSRSLPVGEGTASSRSEKVHKPAASHAKKKDHKEHERPKSAYFADERPQLSAQEKSRSSLSSISQPPPVAPPRYSHSDLLRSFRLKGSTSQDRSPFHASFSSEDLRFVHEQEDPHSEKVSSVERKVSAADQMRQAASRYHKELLKNYPGVRHSLTGPEQFQRFSRKASTPASDDIFRRSDAVRATVGGVSSSHIPQSSHSNTVTKEPEHIDRAGENSIMSRLLREQNSPSLLKIDEEIASKGKSVRDITHHWTSQDESKSNEDKQPAESGLPEQTDHAQHFASMRQSHPSVRPLDGVSTKSNLSPAGAPEKARHIVKQKSLDFENIPPRAGVDSSAHVLHWQKSVDLIAEHDTSIPKSSLHRQHIFDEKPKNIALRENLTDDSSKSSDSDTIASSNLPDHYNVNTVEVTKNSSLTTDIVHSPPVRLDDPYEELAFDHQEQKETGHEVMSSDDLDFLPPPPEEFLMDDEDDQGAEREKPLRTINRKKKDSASTSRNNSCVSTDSITSTGTTDSGIVQSESSPRSSPAMSRDEFLDIESDFKSSREALADEQDDEDEGIPEQKTLSLLHTEQSPEDSYNHFQDNPSDSYIKESINSSFSYSAMESSFHVESSKKEDLDDEKLRLIDSMREKIEELQLQEKEISEEIRSNEDLGAKVLAMVEAKATQTEFAKYELFIGELNKIVALLLTLTQRLHRYELMLQELDMSNEEEKAKRDALVSKIEKLKGQHEEACYLRDVNDRRGENVASFLEKYCGEEEFADFQYYIDMKSQLALMQSEISEKVKLGEERLKALESTSAEW